MLRFACCGPLLNLVGELIVPRRNHDAGICCSCQLLVRAFVDGGVDDGRSVGWMTCCDMTIVMAVRMEGRDDRGFCGVMKMMIVWPTWGGCLDRSDEAKRYEELKLVQS